MKVCNVKSEYLGVVQCWKFWAEPRFICTAWRRMNCRQAAWQCCVFWLICMDFCGVCYTGRNSL